MQACRLQQSVKVVPKDSAKSSVLQLVTQPSVTLVTYFPVRMQVRYPNDGMRLCFEKWLASRVICGISGPITFMVFSCIHSRAGHSNVVFGGPTKPCKGLYLISHHCIYLYWSLCLAYFRRHLHAYVYAPCRAQARKWCWLWATTASPCVRWTRRAIWRCVV